MDKKKCKNENCIHKLRDKILTEIIQGLVKWGFMSKTSLEKKGHITKTISEIVKNQEKYGDDRDG